MKSLAKELPSAPTLLASAAAVALLVTIDLEKPSPQTPYGQQALQRRLPNAATQPLATQPQVTQPQVTQPQVTQPLATQPQPFASQPFASQRHPAVVTNQPPAWKPAPIVTPPIVTPPRPQVTPAPVPPPVPRRVYDSISARVQTQRVAPGTATAPSRLSMNSRSARDRERWPYAAPAFDAYSL